MTQSSTTFLIAAAAEVKFTVHAPILPVSAALGQTARSECAGMGRPEDGHDAG